MLLALIGLPVIGHWAPLKVPFFFPMTGLDMNDPNTGCEKKRLIGKSSELLTSPFSLRSPQDGLPEVEKDDFVTQGDFLSSQNPCRVAFVS